MTRISQNQKLTKTHRVASDTDIAVVILCAGASTRLGQPKQHLTIGDCTLLEHAVSTASRFTLEIKSPHPPLVISGRYATRDAKYLMHEHVDHIINEHWARGQSSSLQLGLRERQHCRAILIMLIDQYRVHRTMLSALYHLWRQHPETPAATGYDSTVGPPVIWPNTFFATLLASPDKAKQVLLNSHPRVHFCEDAKFDLDTLSDIEELKQWASVQHLHVACP